MENMSMASKFSSETPQLIPRNHVPECFYYHQSNFAQNLRFGFKFFEIWLFLGEGPHFANLLLDNFSLRPTMGSQ